MKLQVKNLISGFLHFAGLLDLISFSRLRNRGFILMYHRVLHPDDIGEMPIQPGMYVKRASFEEHIKYLKRNMHLLPLSELVHRMRSGLSLSRCCSITFDDGWIDNYTHAFPLLKQYKAPATVFLATSYIGTDKWFWPEEVAFILSGILNNDHKTIQDNENIKSIFPKVTLQESKRKDLLIERAVTIMKGLKDACREHLLNELRHAYPIKEGKRLLMNWDEVKEMQYSGLVSFGAHTANHSLLDKIDPASARSEIYDSRMHIERNLGARTEFFAYPNGNYNQDIINILKEDNYTGAFTTKRDLVGHSTPLLEIPRIGLHDDVSCSVARLRSRILVKGF